MRPFHSFSDMRAEYRLWARIRTIVLGGYFLCGRSHGPPLCSCVETRLQCWFTDTQFGELHGELKRLCGLVILCVRKRFVTLLWLPTSMRPRVRTEWRDGVDGEKKTFLECLGRALTCHDERAWTELVVRYRIFDVFRSADMIKRARAIGGEDVLEGLAEDLLKRLKSTTRTTDDPLSFIFHSLERQVREGILAVDDEAGQRGQLRNHLFIIAVKELATHKKDAWEGKQATVWGDCEDPEWYPSRGVPPENHLNAKDRIDAFKMRLRLVSPEQRAVVELRFYFSGLGQISDSTLDVVRRARESNAEDELLPDIPPITRHWIESELCCRDLSTEGEARYEVIAGLCGITVPAAQQHVCRFKATLPKEWRR